MVQPRNGIVRRALTFAPSPHLSLSGRIDMDNDTVSFSPFRIGNPPARQLSPTIRISLQLFTHLGVVARRFRAPFPSTFAHQKRANLKNASLDYRIVTSLRSLKHRMPLIYLHSAIVQKKCCFCTTCKKKTQPKGTKMWTRLPRGHFLALVSGGQKRFYCIHCRLQKTSTK